MPAPADDGFTGACYAAEQSEQGRAIGMDRIETSRMDLERRGDWLLARIRGCTQLKTLDGYLERLAESFEQAPAQAVLVDLVDTEEFVNVVDRVRLSFRMAQIWPRDVPMAVVVAADMHMPDRSFEHVSGHQGLRVRTFGNPEQAHAWLASQVPPPDP